MHTNKWICSCILIDEGRNETETLDMHQALLPLLVRIVCVCSRINIHTKSKHCCRHHMSINLSIICFKAYDLRFSFIHTHAQKTNTYTHALLHKSFYCSQRLSRAHARRKTQRLRAHFIQKAHEK